ncbi:hypothetical protein JL722_11578 [Aureococcus anophagefferens]|nr:hypothetical protein JL722_11578 [Aureococcus anophagefferens]
MPPPPPRAATRPLRRPRRSRSPRRGRSRSRSRSPRRGRSRSRSRSRDSAAYRSSFARARRFRVRGRSRSPPHDRSEPPRRSTSPVTRLLRPDGPGDAAVMVKLCCAVEGDTLADGEQLGVYVVKLAREQVETLSLSSVKQIIRNAVGERFEGFVAAKTKKVLLVLDGVDYEFSPGKNGGLSFLLSEALYCDRAAGGPPCFEAHLVLTKAQDLNDAPLTDKLKALPLHGVVAVTFADEGRPRGALAGALFFEILEEDRTRAPSILSRDPTMPALVVHFTRLDAPLTFQVSVATLGRIFSDSQLEKLDAKRSLLSQAFGVADASAAQRMLPNPCTFVCACCPRSNHTVSVVLGGATGPETPSFFDQADVHKLSSPNNLNKVIQHTAIHLKQAQDAKEVVPVGDADGVRDAQKKIDGFEYALLTLKKQATTLEPLADATMLVDADRVPKCCIADLP